MANTSARDFGKVGIQAHGMPQYHPVKTLDNCGFLPYVAILFEFQLLLY